VYVCKVVISPDTKNTHTQDSSPDTINTHTQESSPDTINTHTQDSSISWCLLYQEIVLYCVRVFIVSGELSCVCVFIVSGELSCVCVTHTQDSSIC
jgi:hypothetical protein